MDADGVAAAGRAHQHGRHLRSAGALESGLQNTRGTGIHVDESCDRLRIHRGNAANVGTTRRVADQEVGRRLIDGSQQVPQLSPDMLDRWKLSVPFGSAFATSVVQKHGGGSRELGSDPRPRINTRVPAVLEHDQRSARRTLRPRRPDLDGTTVHLDDPGLETAQSLRRGAGPERAVQKKHQTEDCLHGVARSWAWGARRYKIGQLTALWPECSMVRATGDADYLPRDPGGGS